MTIRTDFDVDFFLRRSGNKGITTGARDLRFFKIGWVNIFLHIVAWILRDFTTAVKPDTPGLAPEAAIW